VGIEQVLVNGVAMVEGGRFSDRRPGRVVRHVVGGGTQTPKGKR
jgi:hypothetical protein